MESAAVQRKPFSPVPPTPRRDQMTLRLINPVKRDRMTTINVSQEALDVIYREAAERKGSFGSISGIVVDYLARSGRLSEVLDQALAENSQP